MNYTKIYYNIIEQAKNRNIEGYNEKHHILPRSLGGGDDVENIVVLTAREHFICHYLLVKMQNPKSLEWYKMNNAFMMMKSASDNQVRYFNSRLYEALRTDFSKVMSAMQSGEKNSQYGTRWVHNKELKESKKIPKSDELPSGWSEGRVLDFDKAYSICEGCKTEFRVRDGKQYCSRACYDKYRKDSIANADPKVLKKYQDLYAQFLDSDCMTVKAFCKEVKYKHSYVNLANQWRRYVPNYQPKKSEKLGTKIKTSAKEAQELFKKYKISDCSSIRDFCRQGHYDKSHVSLTKLWKKYVPEYKPAPNRPYKI